MGNMRFKVGDRVRIKNFDWFRNEGVNMVVTYMMKYYGEVVTIKSAHKGFYRIKEDGGQYCWIDEMIEGLVEEEIIDIDDFKDDNEMIDVIDEYVHRLKNNECQINLPEGYQFTDENGNVINAQKIVLEKKKKEYPKTYEKCLKVLGYEDIATHCIFHTEADEKLFNTLYDLKVCRDAYWKIAGEEMGLGKPWEPDWEDEHQEKYIIGSWLGTIQGLEENFVSHPFAFPTEEMRDAFYENFNKEIEICKELL